MYTRGTERLRYNIGMMPAIESGTYRHYKGNLYEVLGLARHSETLEPLVIYRALYESADFGPDALWARPLVMFTETVTIAGVQVPRFARVTG